MTILINSAGGNWSAGGTWVGGVAPTAADPVSIAALTGTLTIDGTSGAPNLCRSLDCTGCIGTITHASNKQLNIGDGSGGSFTMVPGTTWLPGTLAVLKFVSTTSGNQITWGTKNLPACTFDGVGGVWQFQDAPGTGNASTITLTNGSLDTNGFAVTALLSSSNANTRVLTLGATTWSTTSWDIGTSTGMTLSAASSTITFTNTTAAGTFNGGGLTYGTMQCTVLTTATITLTGANTFATLTTSGAAGTSATYSLSANQTVTGTYTANGNSAKNRLFIQGTPMGTAATITAATVVASYVDFRDITGAGAGSWNLSAITGGSGNCGGNSGITFTTPKNCYMKTAVSVNWSAGNWFTTSGGSTAITPNANPLPQDSAIFDANSVTAGSKTITMDMPRLSDIVCTGVLNSPALSFGSSSSSFDSYGGFVLDSGGMTTTSGKVITFRNRTSGNINGAGVSVSICFQFDCLTGTYSFTGDTTTTNGNNAAIVSGTVSASSYVYTVGASMAMTGISASFKGLTFTSGSLTLSSGTMTIGSSGYSATSFNSSNSTTRALNMGSGTWSLTGTGTVWNMSTTTGMTFAAQTSTIDITNTSSSTKTFTGGGLTYNNWSCDGAASNGTITISGANTFATMTFDQNSSILLTSGVTQTATTLTWSGAASNLTTVAGTSGAATVSVGSGQVSVDYVSLTNVVAAGSIPFYAGTHSADGGGNTNWVFTAPPVGGQMIPFPHGMGNGFSHITGNIRG